MMGTPIDRDMSGAIARGSKSEVLPGEKGTTMLIGRAGKVCANTRVGNKSSSTNRTRIS
jgi:hypothetical protein